MRREVSRTRRRFLEFLASVAVVHAAALALYYSRDVAHASPAVQRTFAWTWMGVTVAVVLVGLGRIKRARRQSGTR